MARIVMFLLFLLPLRAVAASLPVGDEFKRLSALPGKELTTKGYHFLEVAKYDSALIYYSVAANRYYEGKTTDKDIKYSILALYDLGILYMTFYVDYKKSYDYLLQAKDLAEKHDRKLLSNIYIGIANILQQSIGKGNSKEVQDTLKRAFYNAVEQKDGSSAAMAMSNLITVRLDDEAHLDIRKELALFQRIANKNNTRERYVVKECKAMEAYLQKNYNKAAQIFLTAFDASDKTPLAFRAKIGAYNAATEAYRRADRLDEAIRLQQEVLTTAKQFNSRDFLASSYRTLYSLYKEQGDSATAHEYEYQFLKAKTSLLDEGQLATAKDAQFMHELNKANDEVRALSEKRRFENILLAIAVVVIAVVGLLLYRLYHAYGRIRQSYRHLYRANVDMLRQEAEARRQREQDMQELEELRAKADRPKYQNSKLTDDDTRALYDRIVQVMETADDIYQQGFGVDQLSQLLHEQSRAVSQAINHESGNNFNALLNEYRIREACRRLNDRAAYGNYTIEAIAESVGFKSRTSFAALFKASTGLSPSAYQRLAKEQSA